MVLTAQSVDEFGNPADNVAVSWRIMREDVGWIKNHGRFTATGSPGVYRDAIRVIAQQQIGDEEITKTEFVDVIITGTVAQLEVHPALATIAPGRTIHFRVSARDQHGISLSGLVVRWSVNDKEIGFIDHFGNFTAGKGSGFYQNAIRADVKQTFPKQR